MTSNPRPDGGLDPGTLRWLARREDEERRLCEVRAERETSNAELVPPQNGTADADRFWKYAKR